MVTDEILEAMNHLANLLKDRNQAVGVSKAIDMLEDLDVDEWMKMKENEKYDFVNRYV